MKIPMEFSRLSTAVSLALAAVLLESTPVQATLVVSNSTPTVITFTGYTGAGFSPTPSAAQIDSTTWRLNLGLDGTMVFGASSNQAPYARGQAAFSNPYGAGAFTNAAFGADSPIFGITPRNGTWGTGTSNQSLTLRLQNGGSEVMTNIQVSYDVWVNNRGDFSEYIRFQNSSNDVTYTQQPSLNLTTPTANTGDSWSKTSFSISLPVNVATGSFYYLQWYGGKSGGTGTTYDSFGFDNISVAGLFLAVPEPSTVGLWVGGGCLLWAWRRRNAP